MCSYKDFNTCEVRRTINTIDSGLYSVILVGYKIALVGNTEQNERTKWYPTYMYVCEDVCVCVCVCSYIDFNTFVRYGEQSTQ